MMTTIQGTNTILTCVSSTHPYVYLIHMDVSSKHVSSLTPLMSECSHSVVQHQKGLKCLTSRKHRGLFYNQP